MSRFTNVIAIAVTAFSLGGCASTRLANAWNAAGPSVAKTANLKGRAFALAKVTVAPDVIPTTEPNYHCLPDAMYAAMLKADLARSFARSGLTRGRGPAIPVDVTIIQRSFRTNFGGMKPSSLVVDVRFANTSVPVGLVGTGAAGWLNRVPAWRREQRIIPAMTVKITNDLVSVHRGKPFSDGPYHLFTNRVVASYFGSGTILSDWKPYRYANVPTYALTYPMSVSEIAHITGKTGPQLNSICQARVAAAD